MVNPYILISSEYLVHGQKKRSIFTGDKNNHNLASNRRIGQFKLNMSTMLKKLPHSSTAFSDIKANVRDSHSKFCMASIS